MVLDCLGYASDISRLSEEARAGILLVPVPLSSWSKVMNVLEAEDVREVVHLAALSHVSASFESPIEFAENYVGTQTLLECIRKWGKVTRIVVVSTDEVYGASSPHGVAFTEESPLKPTNPYSASKAAADLLAQTYHRCYGLPIIVTRGNNVVGSSQHREKLLPSLIWRLSQGQRALIEGDGQQLRCFLDVQDAAHALETLRQRGKLGEVYNVGADEEASVLDVCALVLQEIRPGALLDDWIQFVPDRISQDRRYFVASDKLRQLGWAPRVTLAETIAEAVRVASAMPERRKSDHFPPTRYQ